MPYYLEFRKDELEAVRMQLRKAMYTVLAKLDVVAYVTTEPVGFLKRRSGRKLVLKPGDKWGGLFDCGWFNFKGKVPKTAEGKNIVLLLDVNGEMCVVDEKGDTVRGMSGSFSWEDPRIGFNKTVLPFSKKAKAGARINIWADAGCSDLFGNLRDGGTFKQACIAVCNEQVRQLYFDFEVLYELMNSLDKDSARYHQILYALWRCSLLLDKFDEAEAKEGRKILAGELNKKGGDASLAVTAVGHSHLDLAWLWPIRETIRKASRTFSTVIATMKKYPDYIFGASQAQLYDWVKQYYPSLYRKIKAQVKAGRWEVQGGMWVEADANLSSGESLVRQFLYGKRFFRREFGVDVENLWLPDVFGYSGALPQIMKKCGVKYFMTQKLSWNEINSFGHHTFIWKGIDGSEVLTHMLPEGDYNSHATPASVAKAEKNFKDKAVSGDCLMLYGLGDGGGGPGEEHLERLKRIKNLSGIAPVRQGRADVFFKKIERDKAKLKTWQGELYLEKHRGTYTTQAKSKYYNRKMESLLNEVELWGCIAQLPAGSKYKYPTDNVESLWKEVLLYQFHDIIPGSSIKRVYDESTARYKKMIKETEGLIQSAITVVAGAINTGGAKKPVFVSNSLSWRRSEWLKTGGKWIFAEVPSKGYAVKDGSKKAELPESVSASKGRIENDIVYVKFNRDGSIGSVFDKEFHREVLTKGMAGNRFAVYTDRPGYWEAWDIAIDYAERKCEYFKLVKSESFVDGPCAGVKQEYTYGQSRIEQEIKVMAGSRRIDFVTKVNWQESGRMLRTSFPVDIHTDTARCEIQFGNIERPTHENTSWDMAKFEVCAQKWIDVSQADYGVALLNDCKYGHKVLGNIIDLNLLRSTSWPDPEADRGKHSFTYSLLPHDGDHIKGEVVRAGYELNVPLRLRKLKPAKGKLEGEFSFVEVDAENVVIETVKKSENGKEVILRMYETAGANARAKVSFGFSVSSASLVNMLEENPKKLKVGSNNIRLDFGPFEIHTIKVSTGK